MLLHDSPLLRAMVAVGWVLAAHQPAVAEAEEKTEPVKSTLEAAKDLTASELVRKGREAFDRQDFAEAEKLLDQLIGDFGENPEVAAAADECRPMLAMCRVKRGAFEEAVEMIDASLKLPKLPPEAREELSFWRGICLLRSDRIPESQEQFGEYFADAKHDRTRRFEAFLLFGTGYIQQEDYAAAAEFFSDQLPKLPPDQREVAGRARVLLLHSLMEADRDDAAEALVRETFPLLPEMTQVVSFQLLTLQLGARLLEEGKWYEAIGCLNRLWPRERLMTHQRAREAEWRDRRERLRKEGAKREALVFQLDGVLTRIARELEQFEKIESYDAALQLRLAQAFMGLERWREAAMLLDRAVATLPDDPLLAKAAMTELQCWQQIPRHDKALAAAERLRRRFVTKDEDPELAKVLMARAEALRGLNRTEQAEKQFGDVANDIPDDPLAARALFMGGICQMEMERHDAAVATFRLVIEEYPESPLREDSLYREGVTLSFAKRREAARERLAEYLKKWPEGKYPANAVFERARCLHNDLLHKPAAEEFRAFLKKYPDNPRAGEAWLLLGESLMAEGEMQDGMKALENVPADEPRLREEAEFKTGEALRKLERFEAEKKHFADFIAANPRSRRLAEAVLHQGRAEQKLDRPEEARALYWRTLETLGDDPLNEGVEDLLLATRRLYPGRDGIPVLLTKLESLHQEARRTGRKTMAARALWARGHLLRETAPEQARTVFVQLGDLLDPAVHHPRMLADCADARREANAPLTAAELYKALRKWHPRAVEKERSSYGLGMIALAGGKKDEALRWFETCEKEAVAGSCGGDAMLERGVLLREAGKADDAAQVLQRVTTSRMMAPRQKARALLELGRCALALERTEEAARHFQRCYLSGGKFAESAAEARLQYGLAMEAEKRPTDAAEAYRELLGKRDLAALPQAARARERLKTLAPETP